MWMNTIISLAVSHHTSRVCPAPPWHLQISGPSKVLHCHNIFLWPLFAVLLFLRKLLNFCKSHSSLKNLFTLALCTMWIHNPQPHANQDFESACSSKHPLLPKGRHPQKKSNYFRALPERGGGGLPNTHTQNFLVLFSPKKSLLVIFHHYIQNFNHYYHNYHYNRQYYHCHFFLSYAGWDG